MNEIDVVVVTYNRKKLLEECLAALVQQRENINKIYVINNDSSDGTEDYLSRFKDNSFFEIHNLESNVGGAKGFEKGIAYAFNGDGRYVWIMDDDTIPDVSAAQNLLKAAQKLENNFGFLCSNVRWTNGDPTNIPAPTKDWTKLSRDGLIKVNHATFVSILVSKKEIGKFGLPIGEMKIWGDDTEYTTRLSQGKESYFVANSLVVHKTVNNLSEDKVYNISSDRLWRIKYMYRNLLFINKKYHSNARVTKFVIKSVIDSFSAFKAKKNKIKRFSMVIMGLINGVKFSPKIKFPK